MNIETFSEHTHTHTHRQQTTSTSTNEKYPFVISRGGGDQMNAITLQSAMYVFINVCYRMVYKSSKRECVKKGDQRYTQIFHNN